MNASDFFDGESFVVRFTRPDGTPAESRNPETEDDALTRALALADQGVTDARVVNLAGLA